MIKQDTSDRESQQPTTVETQNGSHDMESESPTPSPRRRRTISTLFAAIGFRFSWLRRLILRGRIPEYPIITIQGPLTERTPLIPWWQQFIPNRTPPLSLEELENSLIKIAAEPRTKGVIFLLKSPEIGLTQAESLIALFDRFRAPDGEVRHAAATPKQIIAHVEDGMTGAYLAACGADQVYMTPLTEWRVLGLRMGGIFLKETLDRLGIEFDVVRVAPWKSAPDTYIRTSMTKESKEQYSWLIDSLYNSVSDIISRRRNLTAERVKTLIDSAPLTAEQALAGDLIDGIFYEDELPDALSWGSKPAVVSPLDKCIKVMLNRRPGPSSQAVGIISLKGTIVPGKSRDLPVPLPIVGSEQIGSTTVQQLVRAAREDERLAAVVVHVDSPGGSALASDIIWRELALLNEVKPVVIYMGRVAASGGYYVATPGSKIVAQPTTITGSIGVFSVKPTTKEGFAKIGAHRQLLQRGNNADIFDDDSRWSKSQTRKMDQSIQHIYQIFKERVATGRDLNIEQLDAICQGRVWTGIQALEHGLVDKLGDINVAINEACELAGLPADGSVRIANIYGTKEQLAAQPLREASRALHLSTFTELSELLTTILRGDWQELLGSEQNWLLADGLPEIK